MAAKRPTASDEELFYPSRYLLGHCQYCFEEMSKEHFFSSISQLLLRETALCVGVVVYSVVLTFSCDTAIKANDVWVRIKVFEK